MRYLLLSGLLFLGPCVGLCAAQTPPEPRSPQAGCANGATTSISGVVYAPNGIDPLPNVLVYIPTTAVGPLPTGLSCPVPGAEPSGAPMVGATTAADGSFSIANAPVGSNIPLVVKLGKWRRQVVVPITTACADTPFSTRLPRNQSEGDIPRIAIVTSSTDQMECVLRATGVDDAEFTNPGGSGRINLFVGDSFPGAQGSSATPTESSLMENSATLNSYDVLLVPSQGYNLAPQIDRTEQGSLATFVNAGGRAYLSHFEWTYLDHNDAIGLDGPQPPPGGLAHGMWWPDQYPAPTTVAPYTATPGATVNPNLAEAVQMGKWLQDTNVTTTQGLIPFNRQTQEDILFWTVQMWFNNSTDDFSTGVLGDALQIVAPTPLSQGGAPTACGRLVFDDYEIRPTQLFTPQPSPAFPTECTSGFSSPEEKAFEYALFELTPDASALLEPQNGSFGTEPLGVSSAPQMFTWTNNSSFAVTATPSITGPDFQIVSTTCGPVPAGGTCQVSVVFVPTALRERTGYVVVTSTGLLGTEQAFLQGTGTQDLSFNTNYLQFGTVPVGNTATLPLIASNIAPFAVPIQPLALTGDFSAAPGTCGPDVPANGSCTLEVSFAPTAAGDRVGTLTPPSTEPVNLQGIGGDYTLTASPASGTVEAGKLDTFELVATPIGQFAGTVALTCTTTAPVTTCSVAGSLSLKQGTVKTPVDVQTTSKYSVPGYGYSELRRSAPGGLLATLAACLPLVWFARRRKMLRAITLSVLALAMLCGPLSGCSGKYPTLNAEYTPPGTYTVTVAGVSGGLARTVVYTLVVTQ